MTIELDSLKSNNMYNGLPIIKVIGVGGGGGNVVNRMIKDNVKGVVYIAMNTDAMALNSSGADVTIPLGNTMTRGLGAGMNPEIGKAAAEAEVEVIQDVLKGSDMVFLAAGMGGGTGTGAIPVVAEIAKEMEILTVAVVTTPFSFEGKRRAQIGEAGLLELRKHVDTLVTIPNTRLLELASEKTTMTEAFAMADDVLKQAISGITNLVNLEGVINLDFADLKTVMEDKGGALMGTGVGRGENRGLEAVKKAINSPLINRPIAGATGVIINIVADEAYPLLDAESAAIFVQESAHEDADVIFGLVYDQSLSDEVSVTVIATGFEKSFKEKSNHRFGKGPLRVTDSMKYQVNPQMRIKNTSVEKRVAEIVSEKPKPAPQKPETKPQEKPADSVEEIELPHFMRHRSD